MSRHTKTSRDRRHAGHAHDRADWIAAPADEGVVESAARAFAIDERNAVPLGLPAALARLGLSDGDVRARAEQIRADIRGGTGAAEETEA